MPLTADQQREVIRQIAASRADPSRMVACPACGRDGLWVIDRSARPYAEWYAVACPACGLDETLHIPLGPPVPSLD
jgi:hypothetical protein